MPWCSSLRAQARERVVRGSHRAFSETSTVKPNGKLYTNKNL